MSDIDPAADLAQRIQGLIDHYKKLSDITEQWQKIGAMEIDSPLHNAIWALFDFAVSQVDKDGWINWFIFENECGENGYPVLVNGKEYPARTAHELAIIIQLSQ